jgi:hypothetical protein
MTDLHATLLSTIDSIIAIGDAGAALSRGRWRLANRQGEHWNTGADLGGIVVGLRDLQLNGRREALNEQDQPELPCDD